MIFLCANDPIGTGIAVHRYRMTDENDPTGTLLSGFEWVVLSASCWQACEDGTLREVLEYVHSGRAGTDPLVRRLDERVTEANADEEWREAAMGFMTLEMHYGARLAHARREGMAEGEARYSKLVERLFADNRASELELAAKDGSYLELLFAEYGI